MVVVKGPLVGAGGIGVEQRTADLLFVVTALVGMLGQSVCGRHGAGAAAMAVGDIQERAGRRSRFPQVLGRP